MILPPSSEISHHHKVTNITMSPTSLSPSNLSPSFCLQHRCDHSEIPVLYEFWTVPWSQFAAIANLLNTCFTISLDFWRKFESSWTIKNIPRLYFTREIYKISSKTCSVIVNYSSSIIIILTYLIRFKLFWFQNDRE